MDHRFQEMGCHNHAFAGFRAESHNSALHIRQILQVDFCPQISASHHNAIRFPDDIFQIANPFLIFNLGNNFHPPYFMSHQLFQLLDILRFPNKGQSNEIHIGG